MFSLYCTVYSFPCSCEDFLVYFLSPEHYVRLQRFIGSGAVGLQGIILSTFPVSFFLSHSLSVWYYSFSSQHFARLYKDLDHLTGLHPEWMLLFSSVYNFWPCSCGPRLRRLYWVWKSRFWPFGEPSATVTTTWPLFFLTICSSFPLPTRAGR